MHLIIGINRKTLRIMGEVGELSITRAFGDKNYKEFIDCEPDIYEIDYIEE